MSMLLLRLSAPMQSWGSRSRFSERETGREPTKSGVVGLLCAALGKPRDERPEHADRWPPLAGLAALRMGARVDREGTIQRDYHTAGGGRWGGAPYGVAKADGKTPATHKAEFTVTSNRYYLADAVFLVGLEGDHDLLARLDDALGSPVWPLFLGRKAFVPAESVRVPDGFLPDGELLPVLRSYAWLVQAEQRRLRAEQMPPHLRLVIECEPGQDGEPRQDVPLSFRLGDRRFGLRRVRDEWVALADLRKEPMPCT